MSGAIAIGAGIVMLLIGAFWLARQIANAPVGWQDCDGFHEGIPPFLADVSGGDDFESFDDAPDGQPNADRFAGHAFPFHNDGVPR